jgi:hypothetical protein
METDRTDDGGVIRMWDDEVTGLRHLYFERICANESAAILAVVEELFLLTAKMGNYRAVWYMRGGPQIERRHEWEGGMLAKVFCRFSGKIPVERTEPEILGIK